MVTERTPKSAIVIGAGMSGLATAWHLLRRGVKVTVVDRAGVAGDASWGNAGWLTPALTVPLPEPGLLKYGMRALLQPSSPLYVPPSFDPRLWRFLATFVRHCTTGRWRDSMAVFVEVNRLALGAYDEMADGGVREPTHDADPFLAAFASEEERQTLIDELEAVKAVGGEAEYDTLGADEIRSLEPTLSDGVGAGLRLHRQRFVDPPRYIHALADAVRREGAEILGGVEIEEIGADDSGVWMRRGDAETMTADNVVVATGARLNRLSAPFGVHTLVQAGRGYSFSVQPDPMPKNPIYFPAQKVAATPLDGRFRVAGMMEFRSPNASLDRRRIDAIIDAVRPMVRGIDWGDRREEWVGSRPCTADGLPLIGRTRSPHVYVAGGHGMWGIALGPLTGRLLADLMTKRHVAPVLQHFDPLR